MAHFIFSIVLIQWFFSILRLVIIDESFVYHDYLIFMNRLLTLNILKLMTHFGFMIYYLTRFSYWFWLFSRYESFCIVEYFFLSTHSNLVNSFLIRFFFPLWSVTHNESFELSDWYLYCYYHFLSHYYNMQL